MDPINRNSLNRAISIDSKFLLRSKWNVQHNRSLPFVTRVIPRSRKIFPERIWIYTGYRSSNIRMSKGILDRTGRCLGTRIPVHQRSRVSVVQAHQEQLEIIARRVLKGRRISILSQFKYLSAVYSGFFS